MSIHIGGPRVLPWVLTLLLGLSSCCSCPPAEKYFPRQHDPFEVVNGFVYAVETGQWDFVFDCLSEADRKKYEIGPFTIQVIVKFFKEPRYGIPIQDIILEAERNRDLLRWNPPDQHASLKLFYEGVTDDVPILFGIRLYLVKEAIDGSASLWRIEFEKSARLAAGPGIAGPAGPGGGTFR